MYQTMLPTKLFAAVRVLGFCLFLVVSPFIYGADYIDDAQNYIDNNQYAEATIQLKNALQENPDDIQARMMLGELYLKLSDPISARKELERAQKLAGDDDALKLRLILPLARAYVGSGDFEQVISWGEQHKDKISGVQLADLLAVHGRAYFGLRQFADAKEAYVLSNQTMENTDAMLGLAQLLAVEDDYDGAANQIKAILEQQPEHIDSLILAGRLALKQEDLPGAISYFSRVIDQQPKHIQARLMRAETYLRSRQLDLAEQDVEKITGYQGGELPAVLFIKARLQLERKDYEQVILLAEKTIRAAPGHLPSFYLAGAGHYALKNYEQAQFYLRKYHSANSINHQANRLLAATYAKLGDQDAIIDMLEAAAEQGVVQDGKLLYLLGSAYFQTGNLEKGNEILAQAVALEPDLPELKARAAIGKMAAGDLDAAIADLQTALVEDEDNQLTRSMLVLAYLRAKQVGQALAVANQGVDKFPQQAPYYHLKAVALQQNNEPQAAKVALELAVEKNPEYTPSLFSLAQLAAVAGELDKATVFLDRVLSVAPENLRALLAKAEILARQQDEQGALALLDQAVITNPAASAPVTLKINYLLKKQEQEKALTVARQFELANPKSLQAQSLLARTLTQVKRYPEAQRVLEQIVEQADRDVAHRMLLVDVLVKQQDFNTALNVVDQVLAIRRDIIQARIARVQILVAQQQYEAALAEANGIQGNEQTVAMANQLKGDIYRYQGKQKEAVTYYEQAFSVLKNPGLMVRLSEIYLSSDQTDSAKTTIQKYLDWKPNDVLARMRLADIYQRQGQVEKAVSEYEAILDVQGGYVPALNNLAWIYNERQDKRALGLAEKVSQLVPDNPEVMDTYGWVLLTHKQYKKALGVIQRAASMAPTNGDIRYHLAVALHKNDNNDQARKELRRLLQSDQKFTEMANARALLKQLGE